VILLFDDFASLNKKGIEDVQSFAVRQRNLRLCCYPPSLTSIVPHHFYISECGQYCCEEIHDRFPPANRCAFAARWIERSAESGMICPRNAGNVFPSETIEVSFDGLLRIISLHDSTTGGSTLCSQNGLLLSSSDESIPSSDLNEGYRY
jgi:hypothetical protein